MVNCPTVASRRPLQRLFGHLHRRRRVPGVPLLPQEPRPGPGRYRGDRPGPAAAARCGDGRCSGDLVRGQYVRRGACEEHAGGRIDPERGGPGRTVLQDPAGRRRRSAPSYSDQGGHPSLERLVEANTLLSGLGFESSGLAAAHAIHNGLTVAPGTHPYLHGEKVAFGLLVQLVMEGSPRATVEQVLDFSTEVGLPLTLAEIGLPELAGGSARPDRPPCHGSGRDDSQRAVRGHPRHGRRFGAGGGRTRKRLEETEP